MFIKSIELKNFRNIENLVLEDISPGINIFSGSNAQGKTNLIEAVNYLSCARSFRGVPEDGMIMHDKNAAELKCLFKSGYYNGKIEAAIFRNTRRAIRINGLPVKRVSDILGRINTVVFAPEDIRAIKDRPQLRRRLADIEISKIRPSYYSALQKYMSVLKNKSRILKTGGDDMLLDVFNEQLVSLAVEIIYERRSFFNAINEISRADMEELTGGEQLETEYKCCVSGDDVPGEFAARLKAVSEKERLFKTCLYGPHREDFDLLIDGRSVRLTASQGQQRTAMIAFKLASAKLAAKETFETPVLLLDDVFSELDKNRRERLLKKVGDFQVFITATDAALLHGPRDVKLYTVKGGAIF